MQITSSDVKTLVTVNAEPYCCLFILDIQTVTISEELRQLVKVATAGDSIVLVCGIDIEDKSDVIWQRNGVDLVDVQLLDGMKVKWL